MLAVCYRTWLVISPLSHIRFLSLRHVGLKEPVEVCGLTSPSEQDGCQHEIRSTRNCVAWKTSLDGDNATSGQPVPEVYNVLSNEPFMWNLNLSQSCSLTLWLLSIVLLLPPHLRPALWGGLQAPPQRCKPSGSCFASVSANKIAVG